MTTDHSMLEAALVGYQSQLKSIREKIAALQLQIGNKKVRGVAVSVPTEGAPKKRVMSTAARKRIAAAQKKRWAEFHAKKKGE